MFDLNLNFYSLLIPIVIIGLGIGTLTVYHLQKSVSYLKTYAIALIFLGLSIFTHTILLPKVALVILPIIHVFYYISCILHTAAIYQRLQLTVNWTSLAVLFALGSVSSSYFSLYIDDQPSRILSVGLITLAIYLHRPIHFLTHRVQFKIDGVLKFLTLAIAAIALIRAISLTYLMRHTELISTYDSVWALTQMLLIMITVIFWGLFIRCSVVDVIQRLHQERDLDPLTGLFNRRGFYEHLQQMHPPIKHENHAILMADLDHFKGINDQYGHKVGDLALCHVSQIFQKNVRQNDVIARSGGEEFFIVLKDIPVQTTLDIAERLRIELQNHPLITAQNSIPLTVSIGVSFFNHDENFEMALSEADQLLYQAKAKGRNLVESRITRSDQRISS